MKNFDQIERYLSGEMSEVEQLSFEKAMKQDSMLAEEVQHQRFEEEAIDLMIEDELLKKINKIAVEEKTTHTVIPNKNKSFLRSRWIKLAVAASVLLIAVFYIYTIPLSNLTPTELAIRAYEARVPNFSTVRSTNQDQDTYNKYSSYITDKNRQKIEETILFFSEQKGVDALYKTGHAYLLNNDFSNAIKSFEAYLTTAPRTERNYANASFYLALAHLGIGDIPTARSFLIKVKSNPNHHFRKDSESILAELDKM